MLKVSSIKKSYGATSVLNNVCFATKRGTITVIEGKNGAGKSTLFDTLCGVTKHDSGEIELGDLLLSSLDAKCRARHIAVLCQDPARGTVLSMTILENVALASLKHRRAGLSNACDQMMRAHVRAHVQNLGLDYGLDLDRPLSQFSGGQRQMLAFAIATLYQPKLLLLDEPTAALDEHAANTLMQLVQRFVRAWQIPAVMISHDGELSRSYADDILTMRDGILTSCR